MIKSGGNNLDSTIATYTKGAGSAVASAITLPSHDADKYTAIAVNETFVILYCKGITGTCTGQATWTINPSTETTWTSKTPNPHSGD